jgi:DNA topoisomerase-1
VAPPRGAQAEGPGQAHGVPRDHPEAIRAAVANPRDLDIDLVDAQETAASSTACTATRSAGAVEEGQAELSAGRVQSVATRIVVDRERERMAFVSASTTPI